MAPRETFQGGKRAHELHGLGMSCNAIAKELGVGAATISRWAKKAGVSFDRSSTELAVRARVLDMADSRTLLTQKMLLVAHEALDNLDGPYLVYSFGGAENVYSEHLLDTPPIEVTRTAQTIAKEAFIAATKALEKTDDGIVGAISLVDRILDKFEQSVPPADGD